MSFRSRLALNAATLLLSAALFSVPSLAGDVAKADGAKNAVNPTSSDADLVLPKILSMNSVNPVYPAAEKQANVEGMVLVRVLVKADGTLGETIHVAAGIHQCP